MYPIFLSALTVHFLSTHGVRYDTLFCAHHVLSKSNKLKGGMGTYLPTHPRAWESEDLNDVV